MGVNQMDATNGIVPIVDMNRSNNYSDCWGGGSMWFLWIIVLFALMGGWGNGWSNNRNGSALTQAEMQMGFDNQSVMRDLRGIQNGLCDGFYAQNTTMLNGFNGLQNDICYRTGQLGQNVMQTGYQLGAQIADSRYAAQQNSCDTQKEIASVGNDTNRNIDAVRAENYKNTCEIVNAINADGEKTRALMTANQIQDLRDRLADRDRDLQTANFHLSQQAPNATLIGALRPFPQPAYITTSPYQSVANTICGCGGYNSVA